MFFLTVFFYCGFSASAQTKRVDIDRQNKCENICKDKNWNCRRKAYNKNERDKEKSVKICESMFYDCMTKCQRGGY